MKFIVSKAAVALASTLVLAACGGSTVSNNGGFNEFPTFGDLADASGFNGTITKFDDLNALPLETTPPPGNGEQIATFDSPEGALFRVGNGSSSDTLYVGDVTIGWDVLFNEIDGDINQIFLASDLSSVSGSLDIALSGISNGTFTSTFDGVGTFAGFNGDIVGQHKELGGQNYFVVVFAGDDGVDDLFGLGTTDCSDGC